MFAGLDDEKLLLIAKGGNPEPAAAARAILEERDAKPLRGRPRVMTRVDRLMLENINGNAKSERSLQNTHYRIRAMAFLRDDDRFKWLFDEEAGTWQRGILAELGRLQDGETIKAYAARICELKPKTKDAIVMLRRARIGKSPKASSIELLAHLERSLNAYIEAHPEVTPEQMIEAIDGLRDEVEELEEK